MASGNNSAQSSPHDQQLSADVATGDISGSMNNKKQDNSQDVEMGADDVEFTNDRSSTRKRTKSHGGDTIDYPRRRAIIACEICRARKSRCDGGKPKCQLCTGLNAKCVYREPGVKLDAGDKLILERLNRIESLLESNLLMQSGSHPISANNSPTNLTTTLSHEEALTSNSTTNTTHSNTISLPSAGLGSWGVEGPNISTMPRRHTTPALNLLKWPIIRDLVSRPYDPQSLLQLEMAREPLRINTSPNINLSNTETYARAFFEQVNVWYACVNPYTWSNYYQATLCRGFREGPESCVVLLVLALGCASMHGTISQISPNKDPPGMAYFDAAWAILPAIMTRNTVMSAQCMVLASAYLFYLVRPLEAWTMLSNVSMKLQLLLGNPGRIPLDLQELTTRVYWNALLFESDLLAELDLPHSGIVRFEEVVALPGGFEEEEDEEQVGRDELWYFLSEIALRRLLNRVSHLIYSRESTISAGSLEPIVIELDYQLNQWYESLPAPVKFTFDQLPHFNSAQTVLRLRFFSCRTILFRPYILFVLENEQAAQDPVVRENCGKCLDASIRQLEHITAHHAGHLPYLWQGTLSIVSQTLLIMGATLSPSLSALMLSPIQMDELIKSVMVEINQYAHLAPSLRMSVEILREAEVRRQAILSVTGPRV
ncbi:MAG: hypothetical protein M1834_003816 [Cirrosporium novae-zelandiae]|nr:MAG: hypothetical protein M1834_003816 [Cirrosporium novae-zelandiae]